METPVAGNWARAVMIWEGAVKVVRILKVKVGLSNRPTNRHSELQAVLPAARMGENGEEKKREQGWLVSQIKLNPAIPNPRVPEIRQQQIQSNMILTNMPEKKFACKEIDQNLHVLAFSGYT